MKRIKLLGLLVLVGVMVMPLMFLVGCGRSVHEIEFEIQRVDLQIPNNLSSYVQVTGVRFFNDGVTRVESYIGWSILLGVLNSEVSIDINYRQELLYKYSEEFFKNNALILVGLVAATSDGKFRIDNIWSNGVIDFASNGCSGGFMGSENWTFAISVERDFNPRRIRLNTKIYECGEGEF